MNYSSHDSITGKKESNRYSRVDFEVKLNFSCKLNVDTTTSRDLSHRCSFSSN